MAMEKYYHEDINKYFDTIKGLKVSYSNEEILSFLKLAQNGDIEARNKIVSNYLKLVVSVAKKYRVDSISIEDLINEGFTGLIYSVNKYEMGSECNFSSYAYFWIRQAIGRYISNNKRTVRVPNSVHCFLNKIESLQANTYTNTGRYLSKQEICDYFNITIGTLDKYMRFQQPALVSLNEIIADEGNVREEVVTDEPYNPDYDVLKSLIDINLEILSANEKKVMMLHYGFVDGKKYSFEEIGSIMGLTRARIGQIHSRALSRVSTQVKSKRNMIKGML